MNRTAEEIVKQYFDQSFHVVMWPDVGAQKGPTEEGWTSKRYTYDDYTAAKMRVGIMTGQQIAPGKYLHDVDIDWTPGWKIAMNFLPKTEFVYGRKSKHVSHCFYTLPEALACVQYLDPIDKTMLIEIRGTKSDGTLGFQSMVPPSEWADKADPTRREPLEFRAFGPPSHFEDAGHFRQRINLAAIGMLLAKHFGHNGFGHEVRLCWAGYLLRAGIAIEDLVLMGEAISIYCNNKEIVDVRRSVESTAASLSGGDKKVKGGPALARLLGQGGKKIIEAINAWLGRDRDFHRNSEGAIVKDNQDNIRRALTLMGFELSYQEFGDKTLIREHEGPLKVLDDRMVNNIWLRIDREYRFRPTFQYYEKVITDAAYDHTFHPVRDYLHSLTWDGIPRINTWLATYGGAVDSQESSEDLTYLEAVSSIVLIAAVRRIMQPGAKYDEMLVLESLQGLNKSSALRALCPYDEWFSDDLPLDSDAKELIERTVGKWIVEASDLVGGRKADRDHLKAMMSRQIDGPVRMAYAHIPIERPRQFIIIGTTNSGEYLFDTTGSRRFWPVKVGRFDVAGIIRDRDQLWAEAVQRERLGESIRLPEALWSAAGAHQELRREVDAWEDAISAFLDHCEVSASGRQQCSADQLWKAVNVPTERRDRSGAKRISETMQRMGFTRSNVRDNGRVVTGYIRMCDESYVKERESRAEQKPKDDM